MRDPLSFARAAVQRGAETTENAAVRKQLRSIDEGLMEMTERGGPPDDEPKTRGDEPHSENLEELEHRLVELASEVEGSAETHVTAARDAIDAYRRAETQDW